MKTRRPKPPAAKKQAAANRRRKSLAGLMPLEPRVMYDAAGAHTAASHLVLDPHHTDTSHSASTTSAPAHAASASPSLTPTPTHTSPQPTLVTPTTGTGNQIIATGGNTYAGGAAPVLIVTGATIEDGNDQFLTELFIQENN
ncbi:MAG: hypothetical protein JO105_10150, partial [Hyphomicrobiales bacterium]|nr:hypothetical protein [Hyphomicrobiales bacterium]